MTSTEFKRLFVSDVDRTLLTNDYRLLPEVRRAIAAISNQGVRVILATARGPRAIRRVTDDLPDVGEAICFGGALTVERCAGGWCDHPSSARAAFSASQREHVVDIVRSTNVSLALYTRDLVYVDALDSHLEREFFHTGDTYRIADLREVTVDPYKFLVISRDDETSALDHIKGRLDRSLHAMRSHENYLEIGLAGVSKGQALRAFHRTEKISPDDTIAIGDSENDLSMLGAAGIAIAMDNATEAVRRSADWVTRSNEHAGVAWAISEYASTVWGLPNRLLPNSN